MEEIKPHVLSEEEIDRMLSEVKEQEINDAKIRSLTPLKQLILYEGTPGGATVRDVQGNEYLDCTAQAWTLGLGYVHPDVIFAALTQMRRLTHVRYAIPTIPRIKLINRLTEILGFERVSFNNAGGGMAVEAAMKLALINRPGARSFITYWRAYHGNSLALIGGASHPAPTLIRFEGFGSGRFIKVPFPYCYRCPLKQRHPACSLMCLDIVKKTIENSTDMKVAGLIIEPIQGSGGQVPVPPGYLKELKQLCDSNQILLIYDEAQTAFGRVGRWSAAELYGVKPDIMALTKTLGGGFPIGATLAREELKGFTPAEEHTTFGSNPIMFAAALVNLEIIRKLDLPKRAEVLGKYITKRLKELQDRYEIIGDVRGPGLFIGIEFVKDRKTKEPADKETEEFIVESFKRGVLFERSMPSFIKGSATMQNVLKIKPPLIITEEQVERMLNVFDECIKLVAKK